MRHRHFAAVAATLAAVALAPLPAAAQITFAPLAGWNGDPYAGHAENGFTVATTGGSWFEAHAFGNPVPSVYGGPVGSPSLSSLLVTRTGGGAFTFSSVDIASNNGRSAYEIVGYSGITPLFTLTGFIGANTGFETILSGSAALIDGLSLTIDPIESPTSFNVDNIMVATSAVPEPATFVLVGGGLALVGVVARRRRRTA